MIKQNIVKDLFEEMEDKKFIEQADEIICDLFAMAKLYRTTEGIYELSLPYGLRAIEEKLRIYFKGMYKARLEELIREELGKENEELKLGGEA